MMTVSFPSGIFCSRFSQMDFFFSKEFELTDNLIISTFTENVSSFGYSNQKQRKYTAINQFWIPALINE